MTEPEPTAPVVVLPRQYGPEAEAIAVAVCRAVAWDEQEDLHYAKYAVWTVWGLAEGYLRGRIPSPLPASLRSVLIAASTRYAFLLGRARGVKADGRESLGELPVFFGFLALETTVLNRWRVRVL